ncbi:MAG: hypothetical protein ABWZ76_01665 [Acidimicrobiales bacterium]
MRICTGILGSAAVLLVFGAAGLIGTWALAAGTLLALVGGVGMVIVLEDRDQAVAGIAGFTETRKITRDRVA